MKKNWIIVINVLIIVAMMTFVSLYSRYTSRITMETQMAASCSRSAQNW